MLSLPQLPIASLLKAKHTALPAFLSVPTADAAKITLAPNDCHRLGVFPYFREHVNGMFVRVRMDKGDNHVWARVLAGVTADGLAELGLLAAIGGGSDASPSPLVYCLPTAKEERELVQKSAPNSPIIMSAEANAWLKLPNMWRRRIVDEPIYEWREKRFEMYLICEHPFAGDVNRAADGTSPAAEEAVVVEEEEVTEEVEVEEVVTPAQLDDEGNVIAEAVVEKKMVTKTFMRAKQAPPAAPKPPGNPTFIVSLRQLSKDHAPTQAEIDTYCAQFVPIEASNAAAGPNDSATVINPLAVGSAFAAALQKDPLAYVPSEYKNAFMTAPYQSEKEAEVERLEARIQGRVGKNKKSRTEKGAAEEVAPAADADALPHVAVVTATSAKWEKYFGTNVINRALSKDDASKVVAANTRLNNVVGNAVIRGAVLYNLNLSRASQIESARRSTELAHVQAIKAAQKALSRQALTQTSIGATAFDTTNTGDDTAAFPMATQLGASSSQLEEVSFTPAVELPTGSTTTDLPTAADIDALIAAALGPTATEAQISDLRKSLLGGENGAATSAASAKQTMMMLLTDDELQALERDESTFNQYLSMEDRRKGLDTLAAITLRNTKVNIALRLQGYKLMAIRDAEREAHDDTMQTMWVTNAEDRRQEALTYIRLKAEEAGGGDKGGKKDGAAALKGPRYLSEEEELAMYATEAKRANDALLERQGSTVVSSSSTGGASSSSLARAASVAEAAGTGILGASDDLDDLLSLTTKVAAVRTLSQQQDATSAASTPLVRDASLLSQEQRISVAETLGRAPIVVAGAKRSRA